MAIIVGSATLGNWSASGSWVGGVAPTAADDVQLTSASVGTLVIDGTSGSPSACRSLDCTGFIGTITHAANKQLNVGDGTTGAFTLVAGMTYVPATTSILKFVSTSGGVCNITTAAKRIGPVTFDGVGGSWKFLDAFDTASTLTLITLTNGSLDTNGQAVSASGGSKFSSSNSNTRSLTLGATNWKISDTPGTPWDIGTSSGMTLSAASSTLTLLDAGEGATYKFGGLTYGTVTSTANSGLTMAIQGANTFGNLTLSSASNFSAAASFNANQTITGTLTSNGFSLAKRMYLKSATAGTPITLTAGTVTMSNIDLRDITGAGAGNWDLSGVTGGSGNGGGCSGITFNTPKNCYMKTAVSVNYSANNWKTTSGGSTAITPAIPMIQDTVFFDANSVTASGKTITMDVVRLPKMDFTGVLNTPTFTFASDVYSCFGNVTLVSGITLSGTQAFYMSNTSNNTTFTTAGKTITFGFGTDCGSKTCTLQDSYTGSAGLNMLSGTLTSLPSLTITAPASNFQGGTLTPTGTVTMTSGGVNIIGSFALNMPTYTFTQTGGPYNFAWASTGLGNIGTLSGVAALTITAGTLQINTQATFQTFAAGGISAGATFKTTGAATLTTGGSLAVGLPTPLATPLASTIIQGLGVL